jgi:transposase-like protein
VEDVPDPEVVERARRRTYTAKYQRDVLAEYEAADRAGKGALLRREGLYSSLISAWRDQRDAGALAALGKPSGAAPTDPAVKEAAKLRRENERLTGELDRARQVIEVPELNEGYRVGPQGRLDAGSRWWVSTPGAGTPSESY